MVAGELVTAGGVESVNTRIIADAAGIPVASLYQYFADKDEILLALVERTGAELLEQIRADLTAGTGSPSRPSRRPRSGPSSRSCDAGRDR